MIGELGMILNYSRFFFLFSDSQIDIFTSYGKIIKKLLDEM